MQQGSMIPDMIPDILQRGKMLVQLFYKLLQIDQKHHIPIVVYKRFRPKHFDWLKSLVRTPDAWSSQ